MAMRKGEPGRKPAIIRIEAASGPRTGRKITRAEAGDSLRILGERFGRKPAAATVWFGETAAKPLTIGFSTGEMIVTAPLLSAPSSQLTIRIGRAISEPVKFRLVRPKPYRGNAGGPTSALFAGIDELAALSAATARAMLPSVVEMPVAAAQLRSAAAGVDGARKTAQKCLEMWMSWEPLQAGQDFAALRTIQFYDEVVEQSGLLDMFGELTQSTFGPKGALAAVSPGLPGALFSRAAAGAGGGPANASLTSLSYGDIGFWLHELVKAIEATENIFKVLRPSVDAGPVDASVSLGEIFSAIAKFIDIISQILSKLGADQSSAKLNTKIDLILQRLELVSVKLDRQEAKLDALAVVVTEIREACRRIEAEVKANNGALRTLGDLLGRTLVGSGWTIDPRQTLTGNTVPPRDVKRELHDIEDKIDMIEAKEDRAEAKLDRQEEKLDRQEEKLDRQEEKLDRIGVLTRLAEGSVANQQGASDRVSAVVAAVRPQDDRVFLRAAVDAPRLELDVLNRWSDWIDFDRPQNAGRLLAVSIDVNYEEESDERINALLSVRDQNGRVFHRPFEGAGHGELLNPARWSDWQDFLEQP